MPMVSTISSSDTHEQLQTPDSATRSGFGLGRGTSSRDALGLTAGLLDRDRALQRLAALGPFPAGPPPRAFGVVRLLVGGGGAGVVGSVGLVGCAGDRDGFGRSDFRDGLVADLARCDTVGLGHHDSPGRPGALRLARNCRAVTISGASIVTSPAPMVTTTSPGPTASATA